ncbi:MAG: hypothetical protein K2Q18_08520, partial [Bdellovibrionales bacterium]|nr:hypothetical protein [Bdellovibrionales bacterium]
DFMSYLDTREINGELAKYSFTFQLKGKVDPKRADLALKITKKDKSEIDKKISKDNISYKFDEKANVTTVSVNLKAEGAKIGTIFTGSQTLFHVEVLFSQNYSDAGELILANVRDFTLKLSGDMTLTR